MQSTTYRVRIVSLFVLSDPNRGPITAVWEGPVDLKADSPEGRCEEIFRLFNRVDAADTIRLNAWCYALPSLSSGDLVGLKSTEADSDAPYDLYRVASVGFKRIFPGLGS